MSEFEFSYTSPHKAGMDHASIVKQLLSETGWNQTELARQIGVTQPTISCWLDGAELTANHEKKLMRVAIKHAIVSEDASVDGFGAEIVGYVGAGGEVVYETGQPPFGIAPMPPKQQRAGRKLVALVVRGDSMSGFVEDGSIVYYDERRTPPSESLIGRLCVVGMADGKVLLKKLLPGRRSGFYTLYSVNSDPMLDQNVIWAARVRWISFKA